MVPKSLVYLISQKIHVKRARSSIVALEMHKTSLKWWFLFLQAKLYIKELDVSFFCQMERDTNKDRHSWHLD